jgi:hypothetical protein
MPVMKLIGCNASSFDGLDSIHRTYRSYGSHADAAQPQEPIHVQVRIRQYAEALPEIRRGPASTPNLGRMPVGATLDCYV